MYYVHLKYWNDFTRRVDNIDYRYKDGDNLAREQFQNLTEPMYYVLISLLNEKCGVDIMKNVLDISNGRVKVGPGTLYVLLGKFEEEHMIIETSRVGRKRMYKITGKGKEILECEYKRLKTLVAEGREFLEERYEE